MTHIQEKIEQYIDSRLSGKTGYLGYYDRTARRMKRRHLQNRAAAAIGAVLIPVVSNLPWEIPFGSTTIQVSTMGASLIGLGVALILALEGGLPFQGAPRQFCHFKLFVSKVEKAIIDENNVTLNILGRSDAASASSK